MQFDSVPVACPFKKLVNSFEKRGLTRLANWVKRWFNESSTVALVWFFSTDLRGRIPGHF